MHKFPIVAAAMIVAAVGFAAVTKAKRTMSSERPAISMPSIEQMTSDAKDLPVQSFDAI
jgi:hypothetical protein